MTCNSKTRGLAAATLLLLLPAATNALPTRHRLRSSDTLTLTPHPSCVAHADCAACTAAPACGWSAGDSSCRLTTAPHAPGLKLTQLCYDPARPCSAATSCSACLLDPYCGWCARPLDATEAPLLAPSIDDALCVEGDAAGPSFGGVMCGNGWTHSPLSPGFSIAAAEVLAPRHTARIGVLCAADDAPPPPPPTVDPRTARRVVVLGIMPRILSPLGGTVVTVSGAGFAGSDVVLIGERPCTRVEVLRPELLRCVAPPGRASVGPPLRLRVGRSSAAASSPLQYGAFAVRSVSPATGATAGGTVLTIRGVGFGDRATGCQLEATLGGRPCARTRWVSPTALACATFAGTGAGLAVGVRTIACSASSELTVGVSANVAAGAALPPTFAYAAPTIERLELGTGKAPTTGDGTLLVYGANFGPAAAGASVLVDGVACARTRSLAHSLVECTLPSGVGARLAVRVVVPSTLPRGSLARRGRDRVATTLLTVSYDAPTVARVSPTWSAGRGGAVVLVSGANLASVTPSDRVTRHIALVGNAQRLAEAAKLGLDATLTANARQVLEGAPVLAARGARPTAATARTFCTRCEALGCGAPDCVRLCLSCARSARHRTDRSTAVAHAAAEALHLAREQQQQQQQHGAAWAAPLLAAIGGDEARSPAASALASVLSAQQQRAVASEQRAAAADPRVVVALDGGELDARGRVLRADARERAAASAAHSESAAALRLLRQLYPRRRAAAGPRPRRRRRLLHVVSGSGAPHRSCFVAVRASVGVSGVRFADVAAVDAPRRAAFVTALVAALNLHGIVGVDNVDVLHVDQDWPQYIEVSFRVRAVPSHVDAVATAVAAISTDPNSVAARRLARTLRGNRATPIAAALMRAPRVQTPLPECARAAATASSSSSSPRLRLMRTPSAGALTVAADENAGALARREHQRVSLVAAARAVREGSAMLHRIPRECRPSVAQLRDCARLLSGAASRRNCTQLARALRCSDEVDACPQARATALSSRLAARAQLALAHCDAAAVPPLALRRSAALVDAVIDDAQRGRDVAAALRVQLVHAEGELERAASATEAARDRATAFARSCDSGLRVRANFESRAACAAGCHSGAMPSECTAAAHNAALQSHCGLGEYGVLRRDGSLDGTCAHLVVGGTFKLRSARSRGCIGVVAGEQPGTYATVPSDCPAAPQLMWTLERTHRTAAAAMGTAGNTAAVKSRDRYVLRTKGIDEEDDARLCLGAKGAMVVCSNADAASWEVEPVAGSATRGNYWLRPVASRGSGVGCVAAVPNHTLIDSALTTTTTLATVLFEEEEEEAEDGSENESENESESENEQRSSSSAALTAALTAAGIHPLAEAAALLKSTVGSGALGDAMVAAGLPVGTTVSLAANEPGFFSTTASGRISGVLQIGGFPSAASFTRLDRAAFRSGIAAALSCESHAVSIASVSASEQRSITVVFVVAPRTQPRRVVVHPRSPSPSHTKGRRGTSAPSAAPAATRSAAAVEAYEWGSVAPVLWLKATQVTTVDDGLGATKVRSWSDASPARNDAAASVGMEPIVVDGVANGLPAIRFAGNESLRSKGAVRADMGARTTFTVLRNAPDACCGSVFAFASPTLRGASLGWSVVNSAPRLNFLAGRAEHVASFMLSRPIGPEWVVVELKETTVHSQRGQRGKATKMGLAQLSVNGILVASTRFDAAKETLKCRGVGVRGGSGGGGCKHRTMDHGGYAVGGGGGTGNTNAKARSEVAEVIVFNSALGLSESSRVGWYLQRKYSLAGMYTRPMPAQLPPGALLDDMARPTAAPTAEASSALVPADCASPSAMWELQYVGTFTAAAAVPGVLRNSERGLDLDWLRTISSAASAQAQAPSGALAAKVRRAQRARHTLATLKERRTTAKAAAQAEAVIRAEVDDLRQRVDAARSTAGALGREAVLQTRAVAVAESALRRTRGTGVCGAGGALDETPLGPRCAYVFIGHKLCERTAIVSPSQLACVVPPGVGAGNAVTVVVGGQLSARSESAPLLFTYEAPQVVAIDPIEVPTTGIVSVTVYGRNFGERADLAAVLVGGVACLRTLWISSSVLECETPPGVGAAHAVDVVVGGQRSDAAASGSVDVSLGYAAPTVSEFAPSSGPRRGGFELLIFGSGFGAARHAITVRVGALPCAPVRWISNGAVSCTAPPGAGRAQITVNVAGQQGAALTALVFEGPVVDAISPQSCPVTSRCVLTIDGENFGDSAPSPPSLLSITVGGRSCTNTEWVSRTRVQCRAPVGVGASRDVRVALGPHRSMINTLFSYEPPVIASVTPSHAPGSGDAIIAVEGLNFGDPSRSVRPQIATPALMVGGVPCPSLFWRSDAQIECHLGRGSGGRLTVAVTQGNQTSSSLSPSSSNEASNEAAQFSFDPPFVTQLSTNRGGTRGGAELAVSLLDAVLPGSRLALLFGPRLRCELRAVTAHRLVCPAVPAGIGARLAVRLVEVEQAGDGRSFEQIGSTVHVRAASGAPLEAIEVGRSASGAEAQMVWSYDAPVVRKLTPGRGVVGTIVTVLGANFGPAELGAANVALAIGGKACACTRVSNEQLTCTVAAGATMREGANDVVVAVGNQKSAPLVGGFVVEGRK